MNMDLVSVVIGAPEMAVADAIGAICQPSSADPGTSVLRPAQDGNVDETRININQPTELTSGVPATDQVAKLLWVISIITLILTATTICHNPPKGVLFAHKALFFYVAIASIFALGVAEAFAAFWLSRSRNANRRRYMFGRVILCASIVPFIAIVAIGGFAFTKG